MPILILLLQLHKTKPSSNTGQGVCLYRGKYPMSPWSMACCLPLMHVHEACPSLYAYIYTTYFFQSLKFKIRIFCVLRQRYLPPTVSPWVHFLCNTNNVCSRDDVPQRRLGQVAWLTPASSSPSPPWPLPAACSCPVSSTTIAQCDLLFYKWLVL